MPGVGHLSKTQVNEVTRNIVAAGLDPNHFEFTETRYELPDYLLTDGALLTRKDSPFYFCFGLGRTESEYEEMDSDMRARFRWKGGRHCVTCSPGPDTPDDVQVQMTWPDTVFELRSWLDRVKAEIEAPDLWVTMRAEQHVFSPVQSYMTNTPFTAEEIERLRAAIGGFMGRVERMELLNAVQYADLSERMSYATDALTRLGRWDWQQIFVSGLVGHIITQTLTSDTAHTIFQLAMAVLRVVFPELFGGDSIPLPVGDDSVIV
jgi:hypothetical protein